MSKGGNFEREISADLSNWWSNGTDDNIFYRSPGSGGRFTARRGSGKELQEEQGGDIIAIKPEGKLLTDVVLFEAKTGYGKKQKGEMIRWDILDFMDSRQDKPVLSKMWDQCSRDANLTKRIPVLIFRRNRRHPCMMFTKTFYQELIAFYGPFIGNRIELCVSDITGVIMILEDFFQWITDIRGFLCSKVLESSMSKPIVKRPLICPKG
jgi:hypothetical protein